MLNHLRRANPKTQLLVLGILPRGWNDAAHVYVWPSMYAPGIVAVNVALQAWAALDTSAAFLDCGAALLPSGTVRLQVFLPATISYSSTTADNYPGVHCRSIPRLCRTRCTPMRRAWSSLRSALRLHLISDLLPLLVQATGAGVSGS